MLARGFKTQDVVFPQGDDFNQNKIFQEKKSALPETADKEDFAQKNEEQKNSLLSLLFADEMPPVFAQQQSTQISQKNDKTEDKDKIESQDPALLNLLLSGSQTLAGYEQRVQEIPVEVNDVQEKQRSASAAEGLLDEQRNSLEQQKVALQGVGSKGFSEEKLLSQENVMVSFHASSVNEGKTEKKGEGLTQDLPAALQVRLFEAEKGASCGEGGFQEKEQKKQFFSETPENLGAEQISFAASSGTNETGFSVREAKIQESPLDLKDIAHRMAVLSERLKQHVEGGAARIQIHDEILGKLDISVHLDGEKGVFCEIKASEQDTQRQLFQHTELLKKLLEEKDIQLVDLKISSFNTVQNDKQNFVSFGEGQQNFQGSLLSRDGRNDGRNEFRRQQKNQEQPDIAQIGQKQDFSSKKQYPFYSNRISVQKNEDGTIKVMA